MDFLEDINNLSPTSFFSTTVKREEEEERKKRALLERQRQERIRLEREKQEAELREKQRLEALEKQRIEDEKREAKRQEEIRLRREKEAAERRRKELEHERYMKEQHEKKLMDIRNSFNLWSLPDYYENKCKKIPMNVSDTSLAMKELSRLLGRGVTPYDLYCARGYLDLEDIKGCDLRMLHSTEMAYFNTPRKIFLPNKFYDERTKPGTLPAFNKKIFYTKADYLYFDLYMEKCRQEPPSSIANAITKVSKDKWRVKKPIRDFRNKENRVLVYKIYKTDPLKVNFFTDPESRHDDLEKVYLDYNKLSIPYFNKIEVVEANMSSVQTYLDDKAMVVKLSNTSTGDFVTIYPYAIEYRREVMVFKVLEASLQEDYCLSCQHGYNQTSNRNYFWLAIDEIDLKTQCVTVSFQDGGKVLSFGMDFCNTPIPYLRRFSEYFITVSRCLIFDVGHLYCRPRIFRKWRDNEDILFLRGDINNLRYHRWWQDE